MTVCASPSCGKTTESVLKCPVCLKAGSTNIFCDQNCFRSLWTKHKAIHANSEGKVYDPFPSYAYTGDLRAAYPLSPRREVPEHIARPDYAGDGRPVGEIKNDRIGKIRILTADQIVKIRKAGVIGREVLDAVAAHVRPGVTTDELDAIVHEECIKRDSYPSPLNYYNYAKSFCTSVNEVICHGVPDQTVLKDGDIVNLDISIFHDGFHSDLNETYYVGDKAKANPDLVRLVETTREALDIAINMVKPGLVFRTLGNAIEEHATKNGCLVVRSFCGHGTEEYFHCAPSIPHYARNKAVGVAKPGMTFTIEPMLNLGTHRDTIWPDGWTAVTEDGKPLAQFEHMMLVTEDGVELLTGRRADSPGGPIKRIK